MLAEQQQCDRKMQHKLCTKLFSILLRLLSSKCITDIIKYIFLYSLQIRKIGNEF